MKKKIIRTWIKIGYSAMMFGEIKDKPLDWQDRLKYIFDTYLFFLFTALLTNLFLILFPFKGWYMISFYILLVIDGIYIYGYNKSFKKLLFKLDYDPSVDYKKNAFKDFINMILLLLSVALAFLLFVFSFYFFNYFKYLIGVIID